MRIKTKHKILTYLLCLSMILGNLLPFTTNVYGESNIIDSIGSINMEDDGMNVGIDKTQNQTTTYSENIESDGLRDTLVYVSQASTFGVFIPKTIVLSGQDKNANYLVRVSGNIGGTETIKVVPDKTFTLSQYGKKDIVANVLQDKTFWFFNEIDVNGNGEIIANDMSAGSWNGKFNFNISLGGAITVEAKDSNGNDLQASASEIIGEEKTKLLNALAENDFISSINEVNALINVESNDFEEFANTTFNVSNIAKENDKIIILHFDESRQEWEYISTETVDSEGKINANFKSFSPIAFVKVKEDGSYGEHEHIYDNGVITTQATCEQDGIKTYTCYCNHSYTEIATPATGHNYVNQTCTKCGNINYTNFSISKNNHTQAGIPNLNGDIVIPKTFIYNGIHYKVTNIGNSAFYNCSNITSIVIPDSVSSIGDYAFAGCHKLNNIILPSSITSIGADAFQNCIGLTNIELPYNMLSIGYSAFSGCYNLNSIKIPNTLTSIGNDAFSQCKKLTSITLPINITNIGQYAFYYCTNLTTINYKGTQEQWNAITKGTNWKYNCPATIVYNYKE